ncbi:MAG: Trm112 family protein [Phycisphaerae bacterium]
MDAALLDLLVCPVTHSQLRLEGEELVATVGGLRYPIRAGIPVLLPSEAKLPPGVATLEEFKKTLNAKR